MIIAVGCAAGRIAGKLGLPFAAVNTDQQELDACSASTKLQIGQEWSLGYGVGVPELGARAAWEANEEIGKLCRGPVILVAALGAGTGTGAAPMVAKLARERGCHVTAVATMPFRFEGDMRKLNAGFGALALQNYADELIVMPLDRLMYLVMNRRTSLREAFEVADVEVAKVVERIASKAHVAPAG